MCWLERGALTRAASSLYGSAHVLFSRRGDMRAVRWGRSGAAVRTGGGMTQSGMQARPRVSCTAGSSGKRGGGARLGGGVAAAGAEAKATTQTAGYAFPRPAARARRVVAAAGPAGGVPQQPGEGDPEKLRKLQELMAMAMDDDQFDDDDDAFADDMYDEDDEDDEEEEDDDLVSPNGCLGNASHRPSHTPTAAQRQPSLQHVTSGGFSRRKGQCRWGTRLPFESTLGIDLQCTPTRCAV
jgi:hypothetical protein